MLNYKQRMLLFWRNLGFAGMATVRKRIVGNFGEFT